jgi:hypothetical protein
MPDPLETPEALASRIYAACDSYPNSTLSEDLARIAAIIRADREAVLRGTIPAQRSAWGAFLFARSRVIHEERQAGKSWEEIAHLVSADPTQVYMICHSVESLIRRPAHEANCPCHDCAWLKALRQGDALAPKPSYGGRKLSTACAYCDGRTITSDWTCSGCGRAYAFGIKPSDGGGT